MHNHKNILLLGTSHIAKDSIGDITNQFNNLNPDIICIELDNKRLHSLVSDAKPDYSIKNIKRLGFQGSLFAVIGGFIQQKLGNVVGIKPGSDMLTAVNLAKLNNKKLMLIDQDIEITLRNFSKNFTWREKFRLFGDILAAPFSKKQKIDISKVPPQELINKLMLQMKDRYPSIYKTLIDDRNIVMAKNICKIMENNIDKKILIVVGAGHEQDLLKLIKKEENKRDKIY